MPDTKQPHSNPVNLVEFRHPNANDRPIHGPPLSRNQFLCSACWGRDVPASYRAMRHFLRFVSLKGKIIVELTNPTPTCLGGHRALFLELARQGYRAHAKGAEVVPVSPSRAASRQPPTPFAQRPTAS